MKLMNILLHPILTFIVLFLAILTSAIIVSETAMKIYIVLSIGVVWGYFSHRAHERIEWNDLKVWNLQALTSNENERTRIFMLSFMENLATGAISNGQSSLTRAMDLMARYNIVEQSSRHQGIINLEQFFAATDELYNDRYTVCRILMLGHEQLVGKCSFAEPGSGLIRRWMSDKDEMERALDLASQNRCLDVTA